MCLCHAIASRPFVPVSLCLMSKQHQNFSPLDINFVAYSFSYILHFLSQQEDLTSLGKLVLALACYSLQAVQREHIQQSLEYMAMNYSSDLKNLIM